MSGPKIEIYSSLFCGYCQRAKAFFEGKGFTVEVIDVSCDAAEREEMVKRAGGRMSLPQIFIDGRHIGGYRDLCDQDKEGRIAALLGLE